MIQIIPVEGIPVVKEGDDIGLLILEAAQRQGLRLQEEDIVVVAQKIVSKAEGRLVKLDEVEPSSFATSIAQESGRDPRYVETILKESRRIVKMRGPHLIVETRHGFVCANAGVDLSNVSGGNIASLLPEDSDMSAQAVRERLRQLLGLDLAVIVSDTFGRPWRMGHIDVAVGVAGLKPIRDYRGELDMFSYELKVTTMALADELASAAELAMGKSGRVPAVIVRGFQYERGEGSARELIRPLQEDLFR